MRILIVGAGAIGGFYGAHLAQAGRDVTFLVRPHRAGQLRKTGLQLKSPKGDISVTPKLVTADQLDGAYDVILVAVKGFSLEAVMADMAPAMGPQTMILAPLNGMKHVDLLSARFGKQAVVGCACKIAVDLDGEGRVIHFQPLEDIAYGEMDGSKSERIAALDAFMQGAGFTARLVPDIARELWEKWVLLSALGGINCLMRGSIGEVEAAPGGTAFALQLLHEIVAVVRKVGVAPGEQFLGFAKNMLTAKGLPATSSMYRDLTKGAAVEADQIIGDLVARGAAAGIAAPMLSAVYANLCVYQARIGKT
jgi:2-dehydropantoate 2-reductase